MKRDRWQDIPIEVFYHPGHEYNVAHMIEATQKGFDYFTTNFGPYRYREFRIIEFPRYQNSALAYPNTIPYSESVGFIAHASQEEDLDLTFYTTAHELAHQWWGQQVRGYWAQGSRFLTETLAQYSALMVMDKELGPANIRAYLKHELDKYLSGRSGERNKEAPLYLASWQNYVFYHKGSLVMYALQDYLGVERLNAALRKFLEAVKLREPPCSDTVELLKYIREVTPADLQSVVTDLFETITLFDNRAVEASYRETPDHKYLVKLKVAAQKLRADELGVEKEVPLNDRIDIGIFAGENKNQKVLFLEKRRISQAQTEFEITVDQIPTRAGIDPYNKLVDRKPDDNTIVVTKVQ